MAEEIKLLYSRVIWNEYFWLPENTSWVNLAKVNDTSVYNSFWYIFPVAFCINIIHNLVKRNISLPLGKYLGLKEKSVRKNCENNFELEKEYQLFGKQLLKNKEKLHRLAKKGLGEEREIERWLRRRIARDRPSKLTKFGDSCWKVLWYIFVSINGLSSLWNQSWFWDFGLCWENFPYQALPTNIKWYYIIATGYALTEISNQLSGPQRKDHWMYVAHHFATFLLLTISYMSNFTRIGSIILFVHDIGDIFVHFTKTCDYTRSIRIGAPAFIALFVVWTVTRLIVFPYIIYSCIIVTELLRAPVVTILIGMLVVLQFLHVIWYYYMYNILIAVIRNDDSNIRDIISSSEGSN